MCVGSVGRGGGREGRGTTSNEEEGEGLRRKRDLWEDGGQRDTERERTQGPKWSIFDIYRNDMQSPMST